MKKLFFICSLGSLLSMLFYACGKDDAQKINENLAKEEVLEKKIQEIIPDQYLDSLRKLGLEINSGTNPVIIDGFFKFSPVELVKTSVPNDQIQPGYVFNDGYLHIFNQKEDFTIQLIGKNFISTVDTSAVTAISGSGNKFTIYGKVNSEFEKERAEFAMVFSGEYLDGVIIKYTLGILCIKKNITDEDKSRFIELGSGRLVRESDEIAERINGFDQQAKTGRKIFPAGLGTAKLLQDL
ncbi:hypothetical protein [Sphingobacterium sp. LRF_L2]|uniref:hypothetical protein n=1 Tax=Sphingobacterium sp. LRF_L2 TaxID=3369421 RepID=UPI003F5FF28B